MVSYVYNSSSYIWCGSGVLNEIAIKVVLASVAKQLLRQSPLAV